MQLESPNERNIITDDADGGCFINVSDNIVLIEEPSANLLQQLFIQMEAKLERHLTELLCMPFSTVCDKYGTLNFRAAKVEERKDVPYGSLTQSSELLAHFHKAAVIRGLVLIGEVPPLKGGNLRGKIPTEIGGKAAEVCSGLSAEKQREMISTLIKEEELDEFYKFGQSSLAGVDALRYEVTALKDKDVPGFLKRLAEKVDRNINVATAKGSGDSTAKGTGYEFGPMWFAMHLAQQGVWLLPMSIASEVRHAFFPSRLSPLTVYMAVPETIRDIADHILKVGKDRRFHVSFAVNLFVTSSLSSNMWTSRRFCPRPWREMKYRSASEDVSSSARSSAANLVYREIAVHFGIVIEERPEYDEFMSSKRFYSRSSDFHWTRNPTPKSTKNISALVGKPITVVPLAVARWGDLLQGLLPAFGVKHVKDIIYHLNMYLAFLVSLGESDIPDGFLAIDRAHAEKFYAFVTKRYSELKRRADLFVMGKMKMAWDLAARQEQFPADRRNPFDFPLEAYPQASVNTSDREAMDPRAAAFLSDLNCKDDYAFARSIERCWAMATNRFTLERLRVFVGNEAKVLDICLNYGFRLIDARHLDSGEGDGLLVDIEQPGEYIKNNLQCAKMGRQQGVIQRFWYPGPPGEYKIQFFRLHDKSNKPKHLPHMEHRIAKMIRDHALVQSTYNFLPHAVEMMDRKNRHDAADKSKIVTGWPLFRNFSSGRRVMIISEGNCRDYAWKFFEYAQPLLNKHMGYEYPLFIDGKPRFRIHDLRVTNASEMYDLPGATLKDVAGLLGHANDQTALIYVAKKLERVHRLKQDAIERRNESLLSHPEVLAEAVKADYTPAHVKKHAGVESGRRMIQTGNYSKMIAFRHGICPGGDCGKGGPIVGNKPTPVWRRMACSVCRFRLAGPIHIEGMVNNINLLSWEIFNSVQHEREMNEEFNRREAAGEPQIDRSASRLEADKRKNLFTELEAEVKTLRDMTALKQALALKGLPSDNVVLPTSEGYDPEHVEYGFIAGTEWELLFQIAGVQSVPHEVVHSSPALLPRWTELNRQLMRALNVEDVLFRLPKRQQDDAIRTFANAAIEHFAPNEITRFLTEPVDLAAYPNLNRFVEDFTVRATETKGITDDSK